MKEKTRVSRRLIHSRTLLQEYHEKELSRRLILQGALASSAILMSGSLGCAEETSDKGIIDLGGGGDAGRSGGDAMEGADLARDRDGGLDAQPPQDARLTEPDDGLRPNVPPAGHLVGMGYDENNYLGALDAAFAASMDLSFIRPGQTVYFKVNCNNGDLYPHSTRPELIVELAQRCRDFGAGRIIVGDRSFWGDTGTAANMRRNGVTGAAEMAGAELMVFDDETVEWVQISEDDVPTWNGGFRLPLPVVQSDHIINLPCMKTHFISEFTMCLKNMIGLVHPGDRRRTGNLDVHRIPELWSQIAEINQHITPSINILDGYEALITGGPTVRDGRGPSYASPKVIIVSADRVAADITGIAVLQTLSPNVEEVTQSAAWRSGQIRAAYRAGLGIRRPDDYDLGGPSVPANVLERYQENALRRA